MQPTVEDLFERYRRGDSKALAAVFDRTAPELWRVARFLSRGRDEADDLLQATYLAAMQSAARWRTGQPLLPWLLGILANHVRMARRRQRRALPEGVMAPRPLVDPAGAAEHEELRALLRKHVDELPETYRTVLVLQIEHGMTAAEVAHAVGRPRATVRSQLHRGIELLRRALPAGVLALPGWAAASGLAKVRGAVLAAAGDGVLAVGTMFGLGVAMKKLLAGVVVLLAMGVWWAWPAAGVSPAPGGAASPSAAVAAAATREDTVAASVVEPPPERVEAHTAAAAIAPATLRVTARWSDGTPAQGMVVIAQPLPADDWFAQRFAAADARGLAEFVDIAPGSVRVFARHGGELETEVAPGVVTEVQLTIPAGIDARGTVVDPAGNTMPNAIVAIGTRTEDKLEATRTDGNGAFLLRALAPRTQVVAFAEGFAGSQTVAAAQFADGPIELRLGAPCGCVVGRVVDAEGAPLAGAWVTAGHAGVEMDFEDVGGKPKLHSLHVVRTDAAGTFRLHAIPYGQSYPLHAGAAGHASWKGRVNVARGEPPFVEVRLSRAVQLRGIVRDRNGAPAERAYVGVTDSNAPGKLIGDARPDWCSTSAQTGKDGRFVFLALAPGPIGVMVRNSRRGRDDPSAVAWRRFHAGPGECLQWDPVLVSDLAIRGTIVDDAGKPLVGCRVVADAQEGVPLPGDRESQADGSFVLVGCAEAAYTVRGYAPGNQWHVAIAELNGAEPGGEPVVLRAGRDRLPSCHLTGSLAGDQPADQVSILALDTGRGLLMRELQPGQRFELGPLPPGHYALQMQSRSKDPQHRFTMPLVVPLGEHRLWAGRRVDLGELRLPTLGELAVALVDGAGKPVDNGNLRFAMIGAPQGGASVVIAAGHGVAAVAPGRYLPSMGSEGRHVEHAPIEVRSGERTTVPLRLADAVLRRLRYDLTAVGVPARCHATFRKNGTPLQRVWFSFWQEHPSTIDHQFTPGSWELELEFADGRRHHQPFVVTAEEAAPVVDIRVER